MAGSTMRDRPRSASEPLPLITLNFHNNIDIHTGSTNPNNQVEQIRLKLIFLRIIKKPSQTHCHGNTFVKSGSLVKNDQNQQTWLKIKTAAIFE